VKEKGSIYGGDDDASDFPFSAYYCILPQPLSPKGLSLVKVITANILLNRPATRQRWNIRRTVEQESSPRKMSIHATSFRDLSRVKVSSPLEEIRRIITVSTRPTSGPYPEPDESGSYNNTPFITGIF
jgi:hypothetical protein